MLVTCLVCISWLQWLMLTVVYLMPWWAVLKLYELEMVVVWLARSSVYKRGFLFLVGISLSTEYRTFFFESQLPTFVGIRKYPSKLSHMQYIQVGNTPECRSLCSFWLFFSNSAVMFKPSFGCRLQWKTKLRKKKQYEAERHSLFQFVALFIIITVATAELWRGQTDCCAS